MATLRQEQVATAALAAVSFKKRGARSKTNIRKRPASPVSQQLGDFPRDYPEEDDSLQGPNAKRRNKVATVTASSANQTYTSEPSLTFHADRDAPISDSNDATKQSNWHEEMTKIGPMKTSTNVRITTQIDFAPGVCKDYKKTGFCGYGDNCLYAHIREDVEHGWQLDQSWEKVSKGKSLKGTVVASANREKKTRNNNDKDLAAFPKIPFACAICEGPYRQPVVTRCGHYFCEPCALTRYRRDPTCRVCGATTNGVFNSTSKLDRLLKRKRERDEEGNGKYTQVETEESQIA